MKLLTKKAQEKILARVCTIKKIACVEIKDEESLAWVSRALADIISETCGLEGMKTVIRELMPDVEEKK